MKIGVPYTTTIAILGFILGFFVQGGTLYKAMEPWEKLDPHIMLMLFMPALIFESAFKTDWYIFRKIIWQVLLMAGPILILAITMSAVMMYSILGYGTEKFTFSCALMFGAIISATDPVAVVALLKELGAS